MKRLGLWTLVSALAIPSEGEAQIGACYDSTLGPWEPVETEAEVQPMPLPTEMGDSLSYSFPPRIRVDSGGAFSIPEGALPTVHRTMTWFMSGRSMNFRLDWQNGYVGLVGQLEPADDGWAGYAQTISHRPGLQRYRQELRLQRVSCTSPPPVPASTDTPLPLEVSLADGRTISLGPLPADSNFRDGQSTVSGIEVGGVYEGATDITIWVESGIVVRIQVGFQDGGAKTALNRLAAAFGERDAWVWSWSNRTGKIQGLEEDPTDILLIIQPSGEPRNAP